LGGEYVRKLKLLALILSFGLFLGVGVVLGVNIAGSNRVDVNVAGDSTVSPNPSIPGILNLSATAVLTVNGSTATQSAKAGDKLLLEATLGNITNLNGHTVTFRRVGVVQGVSYIIENLEVTNTNSLGKAVFVYVVPASMKGTQISFNCAIEY
jgi:hypothetical protein